MADLINNLKDTARQKVKIQIENGDILTLRLYYLPSQQGWYIDVNYGNFEATGIHLVNSYNVLSSFFNILRFGLSCQVADGTEPFFVDDLFTGRVKLYILSEIETRLAQELFND